MFSRFTTEYGTLIVRTETLQRIEDLPCPDESDTIVCFVEWAQPDGAICTRRVEGTAQENYDRLKAEELELIGAAAERQARADRGLPLLPVPRGRAPR